MLPDGGRDRGSDELCIFQPDLLICLNFARRPRRHRRIVVEILRRTWRYKFGFHMLYNELMQVKTNFLFLIATFYAN